VSLQQPSIDQALKAMAKELQKSDKTQATGDALAEKQLSKAADELRKLAEQMMKEGRSELSQTTQQMQRSLEQASQQSAPGLEQLSKDLARASESLKNQNRQSAQQSLESAAKDLEKLEQAMSSQQTQSAGNNQDQQRRDKDQQQNRAAAGQSKGAAEKKDDNKSDGTGMDPSASPPRQGEPTTLEVQLEQERLAGMPTGGGIPQDIRESSKQQTSRLEYTNVQSELGAARKDLMNRDGIPWEYRSLVKGYMQAIRPK
jgi:DNA repair exonuclease SbcCD ATPase subunit